MATSNYAGGTTTVDDPTDLTRSDYVAAFKRTLKEVKDDDVPGLAAGVAFKMFLSIFPSLFAAVAIFSIVTTAGEIASWINEAQGFLPTPAIDLLTKPLINLADGGGTAAGFAAFSGIAAGLFAATSAAISMMKALSRAYDVAETRKFVKQRIVGLLLTLALLTALVAVALLLIVGRQVQESLLGNIPPPLDWVLVGARFILALLVLVVLFAFVYWIGPNRDHPSWVWMSPGAAFAVAGWLLVSGGFTLYAQTIGNYDKTYGVIAGVALLLIWLQLSMLVILVGAEFNAEVERTRALHLRVNEGAGFALAAPVGAMLLRDQESGGTAISEAQVESHTLEIPRTDDSPTVELAPVPVPSPPSSYEPQPAAPQVQSARDVPTPPLTPSPRMAGAMAAAGMAIAVFLGFARRRMRR